MRSFAHMLKVTAFAAIGGLLASTAGEKAEAFFNEEVRKGDQLMIDTYKKAGVEVVEMSKADYDAWLEVAKESSYKNFAANVPDGDKLIEKALAVE